jgi:transcriptional regulator with XRE-family HTH domain
MTQQDLADLCELSVDQIQKIESGKSWTTDLSFALLADALEVSKDSLLRKRVDEDMRRRYLPTNDLKI